MNLSGNTILITGGGTGIGRALATRLHAAGSRVIITGRRKSVLDEVCETHHGLEMICCDLEQTSERERLVEEIRHRYPELNVLINNAGIQQHPPPLTSTQTWERHAQEIRINLDAPLHLSMALIPQFMEQSHAAIINVTSGLAFVPLVYVPTYSATKAALHSFTQSLRYQLSDTRVAVYEVAPPAVNTDLGGPGKHTFGVSVDDFADHVISQLSQGIHELGFQTSEQVRVASFDQREQVFNSMNQRMAEYFKEKR